jgi:hypothetical protein
MRIYLEILEIIKEENKQTIKQKKIMKKCYLKQSLLL